MRDTVVIGTRGSDLALKQADIVKNALQAIEPKLHVTIKIIKTEGDINSSPIPEDVVGKGWFTKEIEKELLTGTVDIAVHSLKDMPEVLPEGLHLAAYVEREDARDVFVSTGNISFTDLPSGSVIGTDSVRRKVQLLTMRNDIIVSSIRGNVPTRIEKLSHGTYDAVVLAAAGLKRLGLEDSITHYFSVEEMMPAPGQGILVVEIRENDGEINSLVTATNDFRVEAQAVAERSFSHAISGGCKSPTGAHASINGSEITLEGMIAGEDGSSMMRDAVIGFSENAREIGTALAKRMLDR